MSNHTKNLKEISEFMKSKNIMALATHDEDIWACTVYYGLDDDLNLYFVSPPTAKHSKHIKETGEVAFAIFDSNQPVSTKTKQGVYGQGNCKVLSNIVDTTKGLMLWNKSHKLKIDTIPLKDILEKLTTSKVYKITPTKLKMFGATDGDEKEIVVDL